jgi:oxygen-independent coproporphyrinogen-3 oxidase
MLSSAQFDADLIQRYGLNGPRYTSYPTAVSFHEGFDESAYRQNAARSNEDFIPKPLSLYVHLPFCHSLCYYCACNKKITRHPRHGEDYLHWLDQEIALQGAMFDRDRAVAQLHFGGGTPTFFDDAQLERVMASLGEAFSLSSAPDREYSIEIDPRTVDPARLARLTGMGLNRISLGVQDLDPQVQAAVNRVQGAEETLGLIDAARDAGFGSVSIDLIYGLPFQTLERFNRTLDAIIEARPDRLSVYNYAHLPDLFRAQRLIREEDLPTPETRLALLQCTIDRLRDAGYVYIGMDHFALPDNELVRARENGQLQRNFQGYSTYADCDLVGLGVSAIGRVGDSYAQNRKDIRDWRRSLQSGALPVWRGIQLGWEDQLRRAVIEQIMCHGQVDFDALGEAHGVDFDEHFAPELESLRALEADGLVTMDDGALEVTPRGMLLVRAVAMVFDEFLQRQQGRAFSRVV